MKTYLAILIMSALVTYFLTPFAKRLAFLWGAVDMPGERKIHHQPMARLGGVAVFVGFCSPWAAFYFLDNRVTATFQNYERLFGGLVIGAAMMFALGLYDDIRGAGARQKFLFQIVAALGLYLNGYRITVLSNPFGAPIELGWFSLPISVLWMVGITNAMNLLDGIDGLATGVTACIALSLAIINIAAGNIMVALLTLCLAGACLGFLPHNFAPAKIFLGDAGSLFIGLVLSCIGILSLFKAVTATFILVPILLFGLPLYDTLSVMFGRMLRGKPMFQADKTHIHHRLLELGWSQKKAVFTLYTLTLLFGFLAVEISRDREPYTALFGLAILLVVVVRIYFLWRGRVANRAKETGGK